MIPKQQVNNSRKMLKAQYFFVLCARNYFSAANVCMKMMKDKWSNFTKIMSGIKSGMFLGKFTVMAKKNQGGMTYNSRTID